MKKTIAAPDYKGFCFPRKIISHTAWLYFRFSLSFRDVEELIAQRGVVVIYETVRQWCLKFGQTYANELRHRRPRCGDKWHLDEVVLSEARSITSSERWIKQGTCWICGPQSRRNKKPAKRFFRKLLKGLEYVPRVIIQDKLSSYGSAKKEIMPNVEHRWHKRLCQSSRDLKPAHPTTEANMRRFKSSSQEQRFLSAVGPLLITFDHNDFVSTL